MSINYRFLLNLFLCGSALCLLGQCRKSASSDMSHEDVLAVVAGQRITAQDLRAEAEWRKANNQFVPDAEALLKEMVNRTAMVEQARQSGVVDDPDTRHRIESLKIARLREKLLDPDLAKITVTDEEVTTAYHARTAEFARKGLDRFAILFQAAQSKMSEARHVEARKRLETALVQADANPAPGGRGPAASGFGAVAIDYSDDQTSRYRGGDIGWIETDAKPTHCPEPVIAAGRALRTGARSDILECEDGYYVIMKTDSRPGGVRPLEEVAERLRQSLLHEKQRACEERFVAHAIELAKVEMHADAARKVTLPAIKNPPSPPDEPPGFPGVGRPVSVSR